MPYLSLHSPVGDLTVSEDDGKIVSVDWGWAPNPQPSDVLREAKRQLDAYFDGDLETFDLPLAPSGTAFQRKVWAALCKIPYGATVTYGELAKQLDANPRIIGSACGSNRIPIIIPCHRVVAAGGRLGGYSGEGGLATKTALMRLEGIEVQVALPL